MSLLSNRKARKLVAETSRDQVLIQRILVAFVNRGIFGRLGWLLFGI